MYNKWEGEPVYGKEILTGREEDLYKFVNSKNIDPSLMIRLNKEKDAEIDMIPFEKLSNVITSGIRSTEILKKYLDIDEIILKEKKDSLVKELLINNIPQSIINSCVYKMLESNEFDKALDYAKIQAILNPSDANA
ncbi:MAG: hypothetical protein M3R36_19550 [Bacteroidota bacterium]|nr:hypothetical protein [Bacteroidota bacterium]